jgi:hypothetical protein
VSLNQSLIQPFTDAFVAAVDAATPDTVFVTDGPPPPAYLQTGQVVWIGDVEGSQTTIALGDSADSGPKDEAFNLEVNISIYGPMTANATNVHTLQGEQAFSILELIGAKLRADMTLGLTPEANSKAYVRFAETRGPIRVRKGGNDQARETMLTFIVFVFGFLERAS